MSQFSYLHEKIIESEFIDAPFKHVNIEQFFSEEHFARIIAAKQITVKKFDSVEELIEGLEAHGYRAMNFPGCITSKKDYIDFINNPDKFRPSLIRDSGKDIIEGYGYTMRLKHYDDSFLKELVAYFNDEDFLSPIKEKFGVTDSVRIETAIQKNLSGYEISPHCDIRAKALTYMVNIYSDDSAEQESIHTHLLRLKPEYSYIYEFWKHNQNIDTCWVPWDWCETKKATSKNNSIVIFRPNYDTMHAVKLDYDHLSFQRNQIYGNLWYKTKSAKPVLWQQLDLVGDLARNPKQSGVAPSEVKKIPAALVEPKQGVVSSDEPQQTHVTTGNRRLSAIRMKLKEKLLSLSQRL